jgi:hypothetical protein
MTETPAALPPPAPEPAGRYQFPLRLPDAEGEALKNYAGKYGRSINDVVRTWIRDNLIADGYKLP